MSNKKLQAATWLAKADQWDEVFFGHIMSLNLSYDELMDQSSAICNEMIEAERPLAALLVTTGMNNLIRKLAMRVMDQDDD